MGILDAFFGKNKEPKEGPKLEYKGFVIEATPMQEGQGQYRICGLISKGESQKQFIRSDLVAGLEMAEKYTLDKGSIIIDQRGDSIFQEGNI